MSLDDELRRAGARLNTELEQVPVPQPPHATGGWRVLAIAAVVTVVVGGTALWLTRTDTSTPVAPTVATTVPTSTTTTTTTTEAPVATPVESTAEIEGRWRLVSGTLDGTRFADETTGGFLISIALDYIHYPIDCNGGSAILQIDSGAFTLSNQGSTEMNCGEPSEASAMFNEAFQRVDHAASQPPYLVLSGDGVELVFVKLEIPEVLGELPLTAAGELLSFEIADGRQRTNQYLLLNSPDNLGIYTAFLLTTQTGDTPASWQRWQEATGSFDTPAERPTAVDPAVVVTGPGPDTVLVPDRLSEGEYALCSPYWEPDPFCYTLPVPPSPGLPWVVSAGPNGVMLHHTNGYSEVLSSEPTAIAFYIDGSLIIQTTDQPDWILVDDTQIPLQPAETLLDVAAIDGRTLALVTGPEGSATIDLNTENRVAAGPRALAGRFSDTTVILRTASDSIEVGDFNGEKLWERTIDPNAMVNPDDEDIIRLDTFRNLVTDGGPVPFYQYIATELLDARSGQTIDSYEEEVQIPDYGDSIGEPCGRTEFRNDVLLCPQPDGRIVALSGTIISTGASTATFVRSGT